MTGRYTALAAGPEAEICDITDRDASPSKDPADHAGPTTHCCSRAIADGVIKDATGGSISDYLELDVAYGEQVTGCSV